MPSEAKDRNSLTDCPGWINTKSASGLTWHGHCFSSLQRLWRGIRGWN